MLTSAPAHAAVVEISPSGFLIHHEVTIDASSRATYAAFGGIGRWWNPEHSYSGRAENLTLDLRPGGCFREALPRGGGVEHARVLHVAPGQLVRMAGALGPCRATTFPAR